ncbi:MAG: hypothetical protein WC679_02080 [Bacteroidales bacterium]|jgi:hypothetical protein
MVNAETKEFKIGDVFSWRFKDDFGNQRDIYWAKSRIAIVRDDLKLYDTYWGYCQDSYCVSNNLDKIELTFFANMSDLDSIGEHDAKMYVSNDIVDLTHPNTRNQIYKFKGSTPNKKIYLGSVSTKIFDIESKIELLQYECTRLKEELLDDTKISYNASLMSDNYYVKSYQQSDIILVWYRDRYYTVLMDKNGDSYIHNQQQIPFEIRDEIYWIISKDVKKDRNLIGWVYSD